MVDLYFRDVGVGGSNPLTPTTKSLIYIIFRVYPFKITRKSQEIVVKHWLQVTHFVLRPKFRLRKRAIK